MVKIMDRNDNIFDSNAEVLVNPVNVVGVMGAGLAKQFKHCYPEMYAAYVQKCEAKKLNVGKIYAWKNTVTDKPKYIVCFPTKTHWKYPSKVEIIVEGLFALHHFIEQNNIKSIAIPALGCGLGGLDWDLVRTLIVNEFYEQSPDIDIYLYPPKTNVENI